MIAEAIMTQPGIAEDDDALARLRRRDTSALSVLVPRYGPRLHRYLARLLPEPAEADDLFQQTWIRAVERIRQYDSRRPFDNWLFSIGHNLAMDWLRRRRRASLDEPGIEPAADRPGALEALLAGERAALVEQAVRQLPAAYRSVITLRFEDEMKLEEIAAITAAPLSTVKSRLRRALESLRRSLEESAK